MAWKYYDFDANWDKVYKAWQGDAVQDVLEPDMMEWCEERACYDKDEAGQLQKPTWHRGDSLWQYSITDYHAERSMEAANKLMESENVGANLLAAVRRGGVDITHDQLCGRDDATELWNRAFDECERRCLPKRGTLESMILWAGEEFLEDAHLVCACELFPEEQVAVAECPGDHYRRLFLCKQHLVFDMLGYWGHKQDDPDGVCPQPTMSDLWNAQPLA